MMEPQSGNPGTTLAGNLIDLAAFLIGLAAFAWAAFGLYTSFAHGRIPILSWQTSHSIVFGFIWLFFVFPGAMYQVRTLRNCFFAVAIWNHGWSLLPFAVANMVVQIVGILIIPVAWFPTSLPEPLGMIRGGMITGVIAIVVVIAVLAPCNFALIKYMDWLFRE